MLFVKELLFLIREIRANQYSWLERDMNRRESLLKTIIQPSSIVRRSAGNEA